MFLCSHASIIGGKNNIVSRHMITPSLFSSFMLPAWLPEVTNFGLYQRVQVMMRWDIFFLISWRVLKKSGALLNAILLEDLGYLLRFSSLGCSWRRETSKNKRKLKTWPIPLYRVDLCRPFLAEVLLNGAKAHDWGCTQAGLSKPFPLGRAQVWMTALQSASEEEEGGST